MFPSFRFHRTVSIHAPCDEGETTKPECRIIHSPAEEEEGWETSPAAFGIETAPGAAPDPVIAARAIAAEPKPRKKGRK